MSLTQAYKESVKHVKIDDRDKATIELGLTLCKLMDDGAAYPDRLASRLLTVLDAMKMTPKARNETTGHGEETKNPLDELQKRRSQRARKA